MWRNIRSRCKAVHRWWTQAVANKHNASKRRARSSLVRGNNSAVIDDPSSATTTAHKAVGRTANLQPAPAATSQAVVFGALGMLGFVGGWLLMRRPSY